MSTQTAALPASMQSRIQPDEAGCWLWIGPRDRDGYGRASLRHVNYMAHRLAYQLLVGDLDPAKHVDHLCMVRSCVNPEHLELVTPAENNRRKLAALTTCTNGHDFTSENTSYFQRKATGPWLRRCKACARAATARYQARKRTNLTTTLEEA